VVLPFAGVGVGDGGGGVKKALEVIAVRAAEAHTPVFVLSEDASGAGKLLCLAAVPAAGGGLCAGEWVAAALAPVGGKGGGKASLAQGQAPLPASEEEKAAAREAAVEAARNHAAAHAKRLCS